MKISIASDHGGYELKQYLMDILKDREIEVIDEGCFGEDSVDYPDFAEKVCLKVQKKEVDRGILVCGTGIGMSMCANKYKGIRASLCHNEYTAEYSRLHNNANVLCLGARVLENDIAKKILDVWLNTEYEGGRHDKRLEKMNFIIDKKF